VLSTTSTLIRECSNQHAVACGDQIRATSDHLTTRSSCRIRGGLSDEG
jgi:hypothetical protein